jgi:hypothetical protein
MRPIDADALSKAIVATQVQIEEKGVNNPILEAVMEGLADLIDNLPTLTTKQLTDYLGGKT